jgi:hypothetical protein
VDTAAAEWAECTRTKNAERKTNRAIKRPEEESSGLSFLTHATYATHEPYDPYLSVNAIAIVTSTGTGWPLSVPGWKRH